MNGIIGIQILGVCFGLSMIYFTFVKMKNEVITKNSYIIFLTVWIGFIVMSIFPTILDPFLTMLHFERRLDFFIILGFMFLIILVFYTHLTVISLNKRMTDLVRKVAIKEHKDYKK